MKNKNNFIPKTSPIQPVRYEQVEGEWEAIFTDQLNNEYIIHMNAKSGNPDTASSLAIMRQWPTTRQPIRGRYLSLKSAITALETYMNGLKVRDKKTAANARESYAKYLEELNKYSADQDKLLSLLVELRKVKSNDPYERETYAALIEKFKVHLTENFNLTRKDISELVNVLSDTKKIKGLNVSYIQYEFNGRGTAFSAPLFMDGRKVGFIECDGEGGPTAFCCPAIELEEIRKRMREYFHERNTSENDVAIIEETFASNILDMYEYGEVVTTEAKMKMLGMKK